VQAKGAYAFIDLARLGRTDWWSGLKGFLRLIGWQVLAGILLCALLCPGRIALPKAIEDVVVLVLATGAWFIGLRGAVRKSQRRPLLSLVSTDLRFRVSRVGLGIVLWLAANLLIAALSVLVFSLIYPTALTGWSDHYVWQPKADLLAPALISVALIPAQAAAEELVFRGWLTQTLGQWLRWRWLLVLAVGLMFSLAHGFHGGAFASLSYLVISCGFSAVTLLDRRLELAIGVHAAQNIYIVLDRALLGPIRSDPTLFRISGPVPWWTPGQAALEFLIVYLIARWLVRRTRHRLAPAEGGELIESAL
jgi:membrane protease YdiL (CAAX protease family)